MEKAPHFSLENQSKQQVSLPQGKWIVLYFYPKDDTPGCIQEACDFSSNNDAFKQFNAEVIGISPDSVHSHEKFIQKWNLMISLLSDPDHAVAKLYGAWGMKKLYGKEYEGMIRSTFLINPEGYIVKSWRSVKVKDHALRVREALSRFQALPV